MGRISEKITVKRKTTLKRPGDDFVPGLEVEWDLVTSWASVFSVPFDCFFVTNILKINGLDIFMNIYLIRF